jgi:chlorite dismutase
MDHHQRNGEAAGGGIEAPDLRERGGLRDGEAQLLDRRLFVQLQVYGDCQSTAPLRQALQSAPFDAVLYADVNDPRGVGLLTVSEDPRHFVGPLRAFLADSPFNELTQKPELTMLGRTYSLGYEPDLEEALLLRARRIALNPAWPWAVWYPIRRLPAFSMLPLDEQRTMLKEHSAIGKAFALSDLVHDIRLACYGLDANDNDFVLGLCSKALHPLSAIVERMRATRHTSEYLESLGPFFVGYAEWQSSLPE